MAQTSPHQVVLSDEQRCELERRAAAYSGPSGMWCGRRRTCWRPRGSRILRSPSDGPVAPGGLDVAKTVLRGGLQGLEERPRPGRPRRFSPSAWPRSRRWRASCPPSRAFRSRAGRARARQGGGQARDRRDDRGGHDLAVAGGGRDPPVELPLRGSPARPEVRAEGRPSAGSVRGSLGGELLEPGDMVVCADEKPSVQARARKHPSQPVKPGGEGS